MAVETEQVQPIETIKTGIKEEENDVVFNISNWVINTRVQKKVKEFITGHISKIIAEKFPEKAEKYKNSKGNISIMINNQMTYFIMFVINDIVAKYKKAVDEMELIEIDDEDEKAKKDMFTKRMTFFKAADLINYINRYYLDYSMSICQIDNEISNTLISFFNKHINSGDYSLFKGYDIIVFNTVLVRFLSMIISAYIIRIKMGYNLNSNSIIEFILQSEYEKGFSNLNNMMGSAMLFITNYKQAKQQVSN